ncbi:MAG: metallophosphoesterase [Clostridia bacterium]|nr:metallophosphoesterase [Clostridia bacterium]
MRYMILAFTPIAIAVSVYLFFLLRRILTLFGISAGNKWAKALSGVAAAALGACTLNIFSFFGVAVLHIVVMALVTELINYAVKLIARKKYNSLKAWQAIYRSGALALVFTAILMVGGYINLHTVVETDYTVETEKNIRAEGYRVALLSDIHFGVSVDYNELLEICEEIGEKGIDVVVLCGDIVDNDTTRTEMQQVFSALGGIKSEYGVFYVHGNHDRPFGFGGFESEFSEAELIEAIEGSGIKILCDEVYKISDDFVIAGREDLSAKTRKTTAELLAGIDGDRFILTLDHQPREYSATAETATDLVLSGHTHGGQLWPLKQIQEIFKFNDKVYGHGYIDSDTQYIVTSGVAGWKYPIKTASPAEYVIIDVVKEV